MKREKTYRVKYRCYNRDIETIDIKALDVEDAKRKVYMAPACQSIMEAERVTK